MTRIAALLFLGICVTASACGKYGPPVRAKRAAASSAGAAAAPTPAPTAAQPEPSATETPLGTPGADVPSDDDKERSEP